VFIPLCQSCGIEASCIREGYFVCVLNMTDLTASVGGLWTTACTGIWPSMKTNISKHSVAFSDHPWPESAPMFPNALSVRQYLNSYAETRDLLPSILFNSKVTNISRVKSGWYISYWQQGRTKTEYFDFVAICSGFFTKPRIPDLFATPSNIKVIHSSQLQKPSRFWDKNLLIVGNSFSGAELASLLTGTHHLLN
jgi:dimethylaniline monooxygenase (N-oxide forming)